MLARDVWLPPGRHLDFASLKAYAGGARVSLPAPLGTVPLLLVERQILPLLDRSVETLDKATDGTVDAASLADRLDVRVALAPGSSASLMLADGTVLTASRGSTASPGDPPPSQVTEDQLDSCALCFLQKSQGDVDRLRVNGALAADSTVALQEVRVSARGGPARRVRWDVLRLF